jgi:hypothetical protein
VTLTIHRRRRRPDVVRGAGLLLPRGRSPHPTPLPNGEGVLRRGGAGGTAIPRPCVGLGIEEDEENEDEQEPLRRSKLVR